jgi:hypothetical protein
MSRALSILESVDSLSTISEGVPWNKGAKGILAYLEKEYGEDTDKKISVMNKSGKSKDPKKSELLQKVLAELQSDGTEDTKSEKDPEIDDIHSKIDLALTGKDTKNKSEKEDNTEDIKTKIDDTLGSEEEASPKKSQSKTTKKPNSKVDDLKAQIDAALGSDESDEEPEENDKESSDPTPEIDDALGSDKEKPEEEEPKKKKDKSTKEKDASDLKSEIDAALGDEEDSKTHEKEKDVKGEPDIALDDEESSPNEIEIEETPPEEKSAKDIKGEIDTALGDEETAPEESEETEHTTLSGETLGGVPDLSATVSSYIKKEPNDHESQKVLKKISKFAKSHPKTSDIIGSGLGGINRSIALYYSDKVHKDHPTASSGLTSKHPTISSALIGGPTGMAASASYFARKEGDKPRAEIWEKVAEFAQKHPKTAEQLGGGGINPSLAYLYGSKVKKASKKSKAKKDSETSKTNASNEGEEI